MLVVVRHASAGDRDDWRIDDRLRPLDAKGRKQAAQLVELLAELPIRRIVASPYLRCTQTVEALARDRGIVIEGARELGEGEEQRDGPAFLRGLLGADAVACVHGGMRGALGIDRRFPKGAVWVFDGTLEDPRVLLA